MLSLEYDYDNLEEDKDLASHATTSCIHVYCGGSGVSGVLYIQTGVRDGWHVITVCAYRVCFSLFGR